MDAMRKKSLFAAAIVLIGITVFVLNPLLRSTKSALLTSDSFILYSLEPQSAIGNSQTLMHSTGKFHGNTVLGKIQIADPQVKAKLVNSLYNGIENNQGFAAACFNPRHGIRAMKGWRTIDVVICFECGHIDFHQYGRSSGLVNIDPTPQQIFDSVLKRAGVPLGKRDH